MFMVIGIVSDEIIENVNIRLLKENLANGVSAEFKTKNIKKKYALHIMQTALQD